MYINKHSDLAINTLNLFATLSMGGCLVHATGLVCHDFSALETELVIYSLFYLFIILYQNILSKVHCQNILRLSKPVVKFCNRSRKLQ
jgi:hypothetical protein